MARIIGNTTATPNPRPDWNQTDETKADYIKNKPDIDSLDQVITKALEDYVKRDGNETEIVVEILPGIKCYYNGESSYITIEHMYGTATINGNSIKIQGTYEEPSSYFNITLQEAGGQSTSIEASEDVKQAFKDWLGI